MAYVLVAFAVLVFLIRVLTLTPSAKPQRIPWNALIVWVILFGGGAAIWLATTHRL